MQLSIICGSESVRLGFKYPGLQFNTNEHLAVNYITVYISIMNESIIKMQ